MNGSVHLVRNTQPRWIREHIQIIRNDRFGSIECVTCGSPALSQTELATAIGVSPSTLSNFMRKRSLRPDIAAKITAAVKAVIDG